MKKLGLLVFIMGMFFFSSCQKTEFGGDVILFTGTESQPRVTFTIENPQDMGITVSATDRVERDTKVTLALGTQADLDAYNAQTGRSYQLPPEGSYYLNSNETVIKAGQYVSETVVFGVS